MIQEKYHLRLKVLEDTLRGSSSISSNGPSRRQSLGGAENISKLTLNGSLPKRSPASLLRSSSSLTGGTSAILRHAKGTSKSFDGGTRSLERAKLLSNGMCSNMLNKSPDEDREVDGQTAWKESSGEKPSDVESEDSVSGLLYDMLQKEVIALRKAGHEKDQSLKDKDDCIEVVVQLPLKIIRFVYSCCLCFIKLSYEDDIAYLYRCCRRRWKP